MDVDTGLSKINGHSCSYNWAQRTARDSLPERKLFSAKSEPHSLKRVVKVGIISQKVGIGSLTAWDNIPNMR